MKLLTSSVLLASALATAQVTQTIIVKPTTLEQDSKPNSAEVPDGLAIEGEFERVVVLRFKYKADLLEGLERMVGQHAIRNAVILAGIGSVRNYHIHAVSNRVFPSENVFTTDPTKPADIVGMNGYVIDGRIHAHMTLADGQKAFGGHLERGTSVFTFAIVTLGVFEDGIDLSRVDDKTFR